MNRHVAFDQSKQGMTLKFKCRLGHLPAVMNNLKKKSVIVPEAMCELVIEFDSFENGMKLSDALGEMIIQSAINEESK